MTKVILSKELAFEANNLSKDFSQHDPFVTRKAVENSYEITIKVLKEDLGDEDCLFNTRQHLDNVIANKENLINAVLYGYEVEDD